MALKLELTRSSFAVEITVPDFLALVKAESIGDPGDYLDPSLSDRLEKLPGVLDVEYNGHFGNFVYLTIEEEEDSPENRRDILATIKDQLELARLHDRKPKA